MRIGVLTSVGETLDAFFQEIVADWRFAGHVVVPASSTTSEVPGHQRLRRLSRHPSLINVLAPLEIKQWVERNSLDVIVTNTAVASFLARSRSLPCPVVYFCHGLHWNNGHSPTDRLWMLLERFALRSTDAVIVINDDDEQWFRQAAPGLTRLRLPYGVGLDREKFQESPMPDLSSGARFLWAGEFSNRKRPRLAVDVLYELRQLGVEARIEMCGDGALMSETKQHVAELGMDDCVSFPGQQNDIARRLTDSHALLLTSKWEGLPRIGLEALAVRRPVFAFDVKGTRSLPDVWMTEDGDTKALALLIQSELARVSTDSPPESLSVGWVAQKILSLLERVVDPAYQEEIEG